MSSLTPIESTMSGRRGSAAADRQDDLELVAALRRGDESAFVALVERHQPGLVRLALVHVRSRAVAEEAAQDAWVGLLDGLDRFEGRSSVRTWLFRILTNIAKTRGERERRTVTFTDLVGAAATEDEPAVPGERFQPPGGAYPGHWASAPRPWSMPEERLADKETLAVVGRSLAGLPEAQRQVITLRDVDGWSAAEVCAALDISDANQRVLLHRARSRVRAALERYLDPDQVEA